MFKHPIASTELYSAWVRFFYLSWVKLEFTQENSSIFTHLVSSKWVRQYDLGHDLTQVDMSDSTHAVNLSFHAEWWKRGLWGWTANCCKVNTTYTTSIHFLPTLAFSSAFRLSVAQSVSPQTWVNSFYFGVSSFFRSAPKMLFRSAPSLHSKKKEWPKFRSIAPLQ